MTLFSRKLKFLGIRLISLEPSGTAAVICHEKQNPFFSVIMY